MIVVKRGRALEISENVKEGIRKILLREVGDDASADEIEKGVRHRGEFVDAEGVAWKTLTPGEIFVEGKSIQILPWGGGRYGDVNDAPRFFDSSKTQSYWWRMVSNPIPANEEFPEELMRYMRSHPGYYAWIKLVKENGYGLYRMIDS